MSIIAWIVLGAIAGYLAGFLVKGDEGLGVIGHIVLGIVGALVGGFLASVLFNSKPIDGPFDISSIVVATHRRDHHGRRRRDGHQQHPDGPRLDLTRDLAPGIRPAPSSNRTPTACRWAFVCPAPAAGRSRSADAPVRLATPLQHHGPSVGRSRTPAPPCWSKSAPVPLGVRGPTFLPAQTVMHLQGGRQEQGRGCIGGDPTFTATTSYRPAWERQ